MKIKFLTLFPDMIRPVLGESILGRAHKSGILETQVIDIRDFTIDKHRKTDDYPFGGGAGLVMTPQPIMDAMAHAQADMPCAKRIYLSPRGKVFTQRVAEELAKEDGLIFLCGHYEGVDQRALDACIDMELSIGDYVLTGGELGALVVADAVSRLVDGVLGSGESFEDESFSIGDGPAAGLLEYPQYTRPAVYKDMAVPKVLLDGNHADILRWRRREALKITRQRRPDMLGTANLSEDDLAYLSSLDALDRLCAAFRALGDVQILSDEESAAFPMRWFEAYVPAQIRKSARRHCFPSKNSKHELWHALRFEFISGIQGEDASNALDDLPTQSLIIYLDAQRCGIRITALPRACADLLKQFPGSILCADDMAFSWLRARQKFGPYFTKRDV